MLRVHGLGCRVPVDENRRSFMATVSGAILSRPEPSVTSAQIAANFKAGNALGPIARRVVVTGEASPHVLARRRYRAVVVDGRANGEAFHDGHDAPAGRA
jgi:hypothetical protein